MHRGDTNLRDPGLFSPRKSSVFPVFSAKQIPGPFFHGLARPEKKDRVTLQHRDLIHGIGG